MGITFGEHIRELRGKQDLSLSELGRQIDKTAPFLSDIELGKRYPSDEVLADLAKALKTTIEDLKSYDTRAPIDALKKRAADNPAYGIALRKIIEMNLSAEELSGLVDRKIGKKGK